MTTPIRYHREQHAAHAAYTGAVWDMECWDVAQPYSAPRPADVPADATQDYGYLDETGAQHVVFRRSAPATGSCKRCEAREGAAQ